MSLIEELDDAIKQLQGQIEQGKALGHEVHTRGWGLELFMKCRAELQQQAKVDRLMMEFCPDEMTKEQLKEWGEHQAQENKA